MNNKKAIKKLSIYSLLAFLLALFLTFVYLFESEVPDSFDNRLRDYFFKIRGEIPNTGNVVIVDIDEKSIKELGQWPWSRNKMSKILQNLTNSNVAIIGMDVVFAEEDKSSPHKVLNDFNIQTNQNIPNYDLEFADTVANTPTILGYQFELEKKSEYSNKEAPNIRPIFIEKKKKMGEQYLIKAYGTILNTPIIQDKSYSSGFFNNLPDNSGIIRSVPLLISYEDSIYPSLSFEIVRILTNSKKVYINYAENGIENISLNDIHIPTDRHGRLIVNFRGAEKNFKYISAVDIYKNSFKKEDIQDKVVLVGTSAAGLFDLRATPFDFVFPGVEVHANVIDNIIQGDFLTKDASSYIIINLLIIFLLSFSIIMLITYTPFWVNPIIMVGSIIGIVLFLYNQLFSHGIILNIFFPITTIILASILATLFDYFYEIKQEEAIKRKFASKVSKEVMDNLLKNIDSDEFQAMEKEVTVFFSDIRSFTKISEDMNNAKELISYLNEYMEPMSNIITEYQGTIDKYIGDAIMAYWNAPANVKDHADKAVQASLIQLESLKELNKKLLNDNKPPIDIGIGLNTGVSIVGEMGSKGRSDYTVIGDAINLGARLESLCKYYDSKLNISNFTKEKLKDKYVFRFLDLVRVKGKDKPVEIWQVIKKGSPSKELEKELDLYNKAIEYYKNSNFKKAIEILKVLENNENRSNKNIYKIYIERCNEYIKNPPLNFDGVYEHTTKK